MGNDHNAPDARATSTEDRPEIGFAQIFPILRIFDEAKAREFYVDFLGFKVDWEHRFGENFPLYMQVSGLEWGSTSAAITATRRPVPTSSPPCRAFTPFRRNWLEKTIAS